MFESLHSRCRMPGFFCHACAKKPGHMRSEGKKGNFSGRGGARFPDTRFPGTIVAHTNTSSALLMAGFTAPGLNLEVTQDGSNRVMCCCVRPVSRRRTVLFKRVDHVSHQPISFRKIPNTADTPPRVMTPPSSAVCARRWSVYLCGEGRRWRFLSAACVAAVVDILSLQVLTSCTARFA